MTKILTQSHHIACGDSANEWLGGLPKAWKSAKLRWISQRYAGGTPDKNNLDYWEEGTIPWINSGAVNQRLIKTPSAFITESAFNESSTKWVPKGALVMALAGQGKTKGMVAQAGIQTTCNQSMAAICLKKQIKPRFILWWLDSQYGRIRGMAGDEQRDGLNLDMIGSIPCPIPSYPEQCSIASFLDHQAARIDALIKKKQRQIELLQEKRTTLITHAVTKGLNPKAKMKDSGIEWLGKIPMHWKTAPCKFGFSIQLGKMLQNVPVNENDVKVPYLKALNVQWEEVNTKDLQEMWASSEEVTKYGVKTGDLLVCEGGEVGRAGFLKQGPANCIIQNALHRVRPKGKNSSKYLLYLLKIAGSNGWFNILCNKATIAHFTGEKFGALSMAFPPDREQDAISGFLDREAIKIDDLISRIDKSMRLLSEYRSTLISAAVTGKIDVSREAA